jgi:hypothetical protein
MKSFIKAVVCAAMFACHAYGQGAPDVFDDLPKNNPLHRVNSLAKLTDKSLAALARSVIDKGALKLDPFLKKELDKMVVDTAINVAGTGVFLLESGLPRYAGEYLICKDVIAHPKNVWSINDLGIVMRGYKQYAEAVQCFLRANELRDSSAIIKTNAGWAMAYYGDFTTAKQYFNAALKINDEFTSAMEGLSTIAFSEGNIQDLFQTLARQIKGISGGGGGGDEAPGPSGSFVQLCGGAEIQTIDLTGKRKDDPTKKNTYDGGEENGNADAYSIANDEPPNYPSWQPIFVTSLDQLESAVFNTMDQKMISERQRLAAVAKQKRAALPPLIQPPYIDAEGNRVIPFNYQKWVDLFSNADILFGERLAWVIDEYTEKIGKLVEDIGNHEMDLLTAYTKAMAACDDEDCRNNVKCKYIPLFKSAKSSDIAAAYRIWNTYYEKILQQVRWYINATSPFIRKVHQANWNDYLNFERERHVRLAIIDMYGKWKNALTDAYNTGALVSLSHEQVSCPIEARGIPSSNPTGKKIGKLKTFAGPCYKEKTSINFKIGTYSDDCDQTKIVIGNGPFKAFFEKNYSKKFKEDDYYKTGLSVGVSEEIKGKVGALKGKAELSAEVSAFYKFDSYGNLTEKGFDVDLAAAAKASVETGVKPIDKNLQLMKGVEAHFTVSTLCGQNQTPDYRITNMSAEKQSKGF